MVIFYMSNEWTDLIESKKGQPLQQGDIELVIDEPEHLIEAISALYNHNIHYLQDKFRAFSKGDKLDPVTACYPYVRIKTTKRTIIDNRRAYGYIAQPGVYESTLTRPDIYKDYYLRQFELIKTNNNVNFTLGISNEPIPIHFALGEETHLEGLVTPEKLQSLPNLFDLPNLDTIDDRIVNGNLNPIGSEDDPKPLSLFTAPRVDLSLQRLRHYTATNPEHFQNFIIYTNYQFYVDQFINLSEGILDGKNKDYGEYTAFVQPGNHITHHKNQKKKPEGSLKERLPQMPAYHLKRPDNNGITLINIGVGPSNAKTITDHCAVLRPNAWIMLGHCAGLRNNQSLGDYVLAHAYLREDNVLNSDLPVSIPLPALAEIQLALEQAVADVSGLNDYELKRIMRTGTIVTTDDRNWEIKARQNSIQSLSLARAVALDMESATIAANGYRFRVPYGTLLCVSDKPIHGQLKLPGMADEFYRQRVNQHLDIGMKAMQLLRKVGLSRLHSRKLRSFNEVAFQ